MSDTDQGGDGDIHSGTSTGPAAKGRKTRAQQIEATARKLAALKSADAKARKTMETRRKVMVGVAAEIEMERDAEFKARMVAIMTRNLIKPEDRKAVAEWLATT